MTHPIRPNFVYCDTFHFVALDSIILIIILLKTWKVIGFCRWNFQSGFYKAITFTGYHVWTALLVHLLFCMFMTLGTRRICHNAIVRMYSYVWTDPEVDGLKYCSYGSKFSYTWCMHIYVGYFTRSSSKLHTCIHVYDQIIHY